MDDLTDNLDPRDAIARLEDRIAALEARIENCSKFAAVARFAIAAGGALLLGLIVGVVPFDPLALIAAIVAGLGGIVVLGSNDSTRKQAKAQLAAAEAERAALIGAIELRVVEGRQMLH